MPKENGADGVGLFRTEFLFLNRGDLPSEDEQFEAYRRVVEEMNGLPVTIRTFDLGADKSIDAAERVAPNPALGLRAIRLCLAEPQMFHRQLRAILRASHYGKVRILIPMLSTAYELSQTLHLIDEAKRSLDRGRHCLRQRNLPIGGMIEVPAAALSLGTFTRKLDFLSIGTNDLIQYTLAIDRTDDTVAHLYDPLASGGAEAGRPHHPRRPARRSAGSGVRRNGRRRAARPACCWASDCGSSPCIRPTCSRVKQQVLQSDLAEIKTLTQKMLRSD